MTTAAAAQITFTVTASNAIVATWQAPDGKVMQGEPPAPLKSLMLDWINGQSKPLPKLSRRELQTLTGMVNGQSYKQIGYEHEISLDTVRTYVRSLYRKLGVNCVQEAVSYALRHGLVA